jgi:AcrR family transcriptional regulator
LYDTALAPSGQEISPSFDIGKRTVMQKSYKRYEPGHQARKAEATRGKILDAVVGLINESGYGAASSTAISKRAKVTWGAVQHHFGDKEEIMFAVLERSQQVYLETMQSNGDEESSLDAKVNRFVETAWQHYRSDLYFAFTEIIMANRGNKGRLSLHNQRLRVLVDRHMTAMYDFFSGHRISRRRIEDAIIFAHRFLTGFSVEKVFNPERSFEGGHIKRIKADMLSILDTSSRH